MACNFRNSLVADENIPQSEIDEVIAAFNRVAEFLSCDPELIRELSTDSHLYSFLTGADEFSPEDGIDGRLDPVDITSEIRCPWGPAHYVSIFNMTFVINGSYDGGDPVIMFAPRF